MPEICLRRSCRSYLPTPVATGAIQRILDAGCGAPSGANQQPWHMVVVNSPEQRRVIRDVCEQADRTFHNNASAEIREWLADHNITTDKPFLTGAPALIAVFYDPKLPYSLHSVWIAIGFMLLQVTREGLASLPYTPSAANVRDIVGVPADFQLAAILPVGFPRETIRQPRKPSSETQSWNVYGAARESTE